MEAFRLQHAHGMWLVPEQPIETTAK
jgi:hypothetical protein